MGDDDFLCSDSRKVTDDGLGSCRRWLESQIIQMHNRNELVKALLTGNKQTEVCVDRVVEDDVGWRWFERRVNLVRSGTSPQARPPDTAETCHQTSIRKDYNYV